MKNYHVFFLIVFIFSLNGYLQAQEYSFGQAPSFIASGTSVGLGALKLKPAEPFILSDITLSQAVTSSLVEYFVPLPIFLTFSKPSPPFTGKLHLDFQTAAISNTEITSLTLAIYDNETWFFDSDTYFNFDNTIVISDLKQKSIKELTLAIPSDLFIDSDADGIVDNLDLDKDNDGILNVVEGSYDWDNDGVPNDLDLDSDGDGCSDTIESGILLNLTGTSSITVDNNGRLLILEAYGLPVDADMNGEVDFLQADTQPIILSQPKENLVILSGGINLTVITNRIQGLTYLWEYCLSLENKIWLPLDEVGSFEGINTESLKVNRLAKGIDSINIRLKIFDPSNQCSVPINSDIFSLSYPPLFIPNAFTPNNDGKNDEWSIDNIYRYNIASIYIVNRWGMVVFQEEKFKGSWNGRSNVTSLSGNGTLPEGVYFYNLVLDSEIYEGFIYKR